MSGLERAIADRRVPAIGLGCMNLSHAYGTPPSGDQAERLLLHAFDLGVRHFDTAALYGFGANETLTGRTLKALRNHVFLASKCGMTGVDGKRVIDGRPETLKRTCEAALERLQTDHIDLYYLHRWDKAVPIEESVGALGNLVREGKIGAIGLSEVSAPTLHKAHATHPIAAVQSEYSILTRNVEIAVLAACAELGAAFVAFSPLSRGMLADDLTGSYVEKDIRHGMPRFVAPNLEHNRQTARGLAEIARHNDIAPAQLALAWVLGRGPHVHVIPGTTSAAHLEQNVQTEKVTLSGAIYAEIDEVLARRPIHGPRYNAATQAEIDTEEFARSPA